MIGWIKKYVKTWTPSGFLEEAKSLGVTVRVWFAARVLALLVALLLTVFIVRFFNSLLSS